MFPGIGGTLVHVPPFDVFFSGPQYTPQEFFAQITRPPFFLFFVISGVRSRENSVLRLVAVLFLIPLSAQPGGTSQTRQIAKVYGQRLKTVFFGHAYHVGQCNAMWFRFVRSRENRSKPISVPSQAVGWSPPFPPSWANHPILSVGKEPSDSSRLSFFSDPLHVLLITTVANPLLTVGVFFRYAPLFHTRLVTPMDLIERPVRLELQTQSCFYPPIGTRRKLC